MKKLIRATLVLWLMGARMCVGQVSAANPPLITTIPIPKGMSLISLIGFDTITFDFERAGLVPPHWGFEVGKDGIGRYYKKTAPTNGNESGNVWTDVRISASTLALLGGGADRDAPECETKSKHIAQTGKKVLTYWKGDAPFVCTFNYSDNIKVMRTAETFQALAETLQYGERLQHERRFDRLSLDAEMQSLTAEVASGRAIEVGNIAGTLQGLVDDDRVIDRVRRAAARLLEQAGEKK